MLKYSLENKPKIMKKFKKKSTIEAVFVSVPFQIVGQEGVQYIAPDTVDDWAGGYYVAYPDDHSKPYPISKKYMEDNYEEIK